MGLLIWSSLLAADQESAVTNSDNKGKQWAREEAWLNARVFQAAPGLWPAAYFWMPSGMSNASSKISAGNFRSVLGLQTAFGAAAVLGVAFAVVFLAFIVIFLCTESSLHTNTIRKRVK
jgi:hypothetical protein